MSNGEPAQDASALLEALFEHAPTGVGFFDTDLRVRRVNDRLADILGAPVHLCVGRRVPEIAGGAGEDLEALFREILASGAPVPERLVRARLRSRPGDEREFLTSYFPVRDDAGTIVGIAGTVQELTAERAAGGEHARLLKDALVARAHAEAAQVRAEGAQAEAERARARTAFIAEAGARMATLLDTEHAMAELARMSVPAVADWCVIALVDRDGAMRPVAAAHADPEREAVVWELARRLAIAPVGTSSPEAVLRTGRPEISPEISEDELRRLSVDDEHLAQLRRLGVISSLIVPLKTPERRIGTVTLVTGDSGRRFGDEDVAMARALAARASLHAENARLYTERSEIAQTLQDALVPGELPAIPGIDLAVRYRAAGDQNHVGGDFYDVYATGEDTWTAVVGDDSGKGAEAAVLTALTRHTLYAGALRDQDPVANLLLLNEALLRRSGGPSRFCTVVTASLSPRGDGSVAIKLANGGHPPPLVLRAGGTVVETTARGTLIGAVPGPRLVPEDIVLQPGDLLLLFTDGVTELRTDDPEEGARRLRACLEAHAGRPAAEVVAAVERTVGEVTGGEPRDDVALLAVRALPSTF
jgi:PAS domain S-box-containing protein